MRMVQPPEYRPNAGPAPFIVRLLGARERPAGKAPGDRVETLSVLPGRGQGDQDSPGRPSTFSAGMGVLVASKRIVTCAHVVNVALGREPREQGYPAPPVLVDFPTLGPSQGQAVVHYAHVECWKPPPKHPGDAGADIAGLRLILDETDALPVGIEPARMLLDLPSIDQKLLVFGCPSVRPAGVYALAQARGPIGDLLYLDSVESAAWWVQPGFSGSPVYDPETGCVVGIVALAARSDARALAGEAYAITARALVASWPEAEMVACSPSVKAEIEIHAKFEFHVDSLKDLDTVSSSAPVVIQGHYKGKPPPMRVLLQDSYGNYYVQNPPVNFAPDGRWYATNICVGEGILFVIFLELDEAAATEFRNMVWGRQFGGFSRLPEGSRILKMIQINRE